MMQQGSFPLTVGLGSVLYILSGLLLQSVSLVKQAVSRKDRLLFGFRREGLRDMLKRQFSHFLLEECTRRKDRAAESIVEGVWQRVEGMVSYSQIKVSRKQAQPTTMSPSRGWVLLMLPREGEMHAGRSTCSFSPREHTWTTDYLLSCKVVFVIWRDQTLQ